MHRIKRDRRIIENKGVIGRVQHIRRVSITIGERGPAHLDKAVVPFCDARIQRRLRLHGDDGRSGGGHGIGTGGIAARTGTVEDHLIEVLEKPVVDQLVEECIDQRIAEPRVAVRHDAQM